VDEREENEKSTPVIKAGLGVPQCRNSGATQYWIFSFLMLFTI
jgi:hypothetical protein